MHFFLLLLPLAAFAHTPADFQGEWQQECRGSKRKTEIFIANTVTLAEEYFPERICAGEPSVTHLSSGEFLLPGAGLMDFRFSEVSVIPGEKIAALYNEKAVCGLTNWEAGKSQDVTGLRCDFFFLGRPVPVPASGDMRYGIYALEGNFLRFGRLSSQKNGLTPETRPTELDPEPFRRLP